MVDGHCSSPQPMNSDVLRDSDLSPVFFLLLINEPLKTNFLIHLCGEESTLHYSVLQRAFHRTVIIQFKFGGCRTLNQ